MFPMPRANINVEQLLAICGQKQKKSTLKEQHEQQNQ